MEKGVVLWFDIKKGFGFIKSDEEDNDVFVHYSKIEGEDGEFKILSEGDKVQFTTIYIDRNGIQKKQAKNVSLVTLI
jgi:CspA family cold shock protein